MHVKIALDAKLCWRTLNPKLLGLAALVRQHFLLRFMACIFCILSVGLLVELWLFVVVVVVVVVVAVVVVVVVVGCCWLLVVVCC